MRLLISGILLTALVGSGQSFETVGASPGWESVLRSLGQVPVQDGPARVVVLADPGQWSFAKLQERVSAGALVVIEGHSALAEALGVLRGQGVVKVRQIRDVASPELPVVWAEEAELRPALLGDGWQVRARDRWSETAMLAIRKMGRGAVLWTATGIGASGYERYPFLPQALVAGGLEARVEGKGLWAFFDAGYRQRVDLTYLVAQWKRAGIGAIHVTSWQFDGATAERAEWLGKLIALCHKNLIQVYAWVELPHVSERFWQRYPECRERTASGMEASLDWRRLVNLVNPRCADLAEVSVMSLLRSFDWDGVNLGELYFESLEGHENPVRFTPFNDDVRAEYRKLHNREMLDDLRGEGLPKLLEYRANLAARLQADWLRKLETLRRDKPDFDIVLTHIDDRFDTRMRDALGADAARLLRDTEGLGTGFLIEDPATVWHLGPARYREIRKRYEGLTKEPERLSIDLNVVDRYQDVYPTRRQTGAELMQLVHEAAASFEQVALYFEYSLRPVDLPLLGMAAARVVAWKEQDGLLELSLGGPARVRWQGAARVNGILWPLTDGEFILLPAGNWRVEKAAEMPALRIRDTSVRPLRVSQDASSYTIDYESRTAGAMLVESQAGLERVQVSRGKGSFRLSAKPPGVEAVRNSTQPLLHR